MSRIRTIKPEFPQSESVGRLSRDARLLFIQIWTIADDSGKARGNSRALASLLFPYDDDAPSLIDGWLAELEQNGFIFRYDCDGSRYLQVVNWLKHQKIDRPTPSRFPDPRESSTNPRESSRVLGEPSLLDQGPRTKDQGPRIKDRDDEDRPSPRSEPSASLRSLAERFYRAYPKHVDPADAQKRFLACVKKGDDPEQIISAAERYAEAHRLAGTDKKFIPAPAVWLNKGGYLSEDLPAPTRPTLALVAANRPAAFQTSKPAANF